MIRVGVLTTGDPHSRAELFWTYPSRVGGMEYIQKLLHHANCICHVPLTVARDCCHFLSSSRYPYSLGTLYTKGLKGQFLDPVLKVRKVLFERLTACVVFFSVSLQPC